MFLNQEVPQISAGINPHHTYHVHNPKLVVQIKKSVEITPGIKPHDVYHVYSYKMCLEIKNVMKLLLVSMVVTSNIIFIMFIMTRGG